MLRFIAIAALAAALSSPAMAEPGFVKTISLPIQGFSDGLGPRAACELPASLSIPEPAVTAPGRAVTLSPRMLQAIRIDEAAPVD